MELVTRFKARVRRLFAPSWRCTSCGKSYRRNPRRCSNCGGTVFERA